MSFKLTSFISWISIRKLLRFIEEKPHQSKLTKLNCRPFEKYNYLALKGYGPWVISPTVLTSDALKFTFASWEKIYLRWNDKIQGIFLPHFFIERFQAGDTVWNKHLTFSYKRRGKLSGMPKTHKKAEFREAKFLLWIFFVFHINYWNQ